MHGYSTHIVKQIFSACVGCGIPDEPVNGKSNFKSTKFGKMVTYHCDVGYVLHGASSRECLNTGVWNGSVPVCGRVFLATLLFP